MQYYRPERGAAHPCVRDSDHILDPPLGEFLRDREVTRLGHAFARMGAGILQHQHVLRSDVESRIIDARGKIGKGGENHCPALVLEQFCIGCRALENGALGSEVSEQGDEPPLWFERLVAAGNNRPVDVTGVIGRKALAQRLAGHRHAIKVEQRLELAQKRAHPAGGEKILHIAVADRLEVDQYRRRIRELIELLERNPHTDPTGDRGEVDHRVGRAAERKKGTQRILDRLRVDDLVGCALRADESCGRSAGCLRRAQPVGVHRRDCGGARQDKTERLGDAGHGGGRAHHRAGPSGDCELSFDLRYFLLGDITRAITRPETTTIGAGAESLAAMAARHHGASHQHDRRPAGGHRAHELRRHGLVAAAHEHDRVHGLRPDHFLRVNRHQVAVFEARGAEKDFAQRDRGEGDRQRAGREHSALDRVQQFGEVAVAIVETGRRIGDADHGLR